VQRDNLPIAEQMQSLCSKAVPLKRVIIGGVVVDGYIGG
jgi:hypothetical protein